MNMSQCHIYHCIVANLVVYDRAEVVHNKTVHLPLFSECLGSSRGRGREREKWGKKREKGKREKGKREKGKRERGKREGRECIVLKVIEIKLKYVASSKGAGIETKKLEC